MIKVVRYTIDFIEEILSANYNIYLKVENS